MPLSPMMKYYFTIKEQYKDCLVFFRLGDFYEMFYDDAIEASKVLDLTLTGRDCGLDNKAPMCGVPHHAVDTYIAKLIAKDYKVAICEQLSTPDASKGLVERGVVRIITPGTIIEDNILVETKNNYLACLCGNNKIYSMSWLDISTGEFNVFESTYKDINEIEDMLYTISPAEIIASPYIKEREDEFKSVKLKKIPTFNLYSNYIYEYEQAYKTLCTKFNCQSLDFLGLKDKKFAVCAAGALLAYVNNMQMRSMVNITTLKYIQNDKFLILDVNARRNLEILENTKDGSRTGTLISILDKTTTCMGARNIRRWLEQPLRDSKQINERLDAVTELFSNPAIRGNLHELLVGIKDIERIAARISFGNCTPRDFGAIKSSLAKLPPIKEVLNNTASDLLHKINDNIFLLDEIYNLLDKAINDNNLPLTIRDGGFIKDGYSIELDEYRFLKRDGRSLLLKEEIKEKEETGIKTLKVGYNKVFGYFIEVSKGQIDRVPDNYIRKQTLANCERYVTEKLKSIEEKLQDAEANALTLEQKIFNEIKDTLTKAIPFIQSTAQNIGYLDTLLSFSIVSNLYNYTRPTINTTIDSIRIINGRHPVVENFVETGNFVPNDTTLDSHNNRTMIITGPNMAGKSTYMRQVALITFMAHIGCFVPADKADISITDRIFTRIGASDDLTYGQSTFMVEMVEVATILANATFKSLLILDEIGRGTSTYDGLSIAKAVVEEITDKIRCKTLFSTHYHELTELEGYIEGVKNYKILATEVNKNVIFLHKIQKGGTNKSFGVEVAQLAGFPKSVISRAKEISKQLEKSPLKVIQTENTDSFGLIKLVQENSILDKLKSIDIENLTPVQSFGILFDLIKEAKNNV